MTLADVPADAEVLRSTPAFDSGRVIAVRTDEVRLPGGETVTRDVVVHPGAVGIIALDADERVLFVHQYRHPVRRRLWEPPAGLLDQPGEAPLAAARRELYEEAHVQAEDWRVLVDAFTSPGMSSEAVRVYLARRVSAAAGERHEAEAEERDMTLRWEPLPAAVDAALSGRLHNPLAVMGVLALAAARARDDGYASLRPADAPWPERA